MMFPRQVEVPRGAGRPERRQWFTVVLLLLALARGVDAQVAQKR